MIDTHLGLLRLSANLSAIYLDIVALHPTSGSLTFRFFRRSARGIAVAIGDRKEQSSRRVRPTDRFVNAAVVPVA